MKILSFTTLALSLGLTVGPAIAGVAPKVAVNGVLPGGPPAVQERDIIGRGNGKGKRSLSVSKLAENRSNLFYRMPPRQTLDFCEESVSPPPEI